MTKNTIKANGSRLVNEDYLALATLLVKAGYSVRITTRKIPGKEAKEKVVEFWEEEQR